MNSNVLFRHFLELSPEEREALGRLTTSVPPRLSSFSHWLRSPNPLGMYASLVSEDGRIAGWAAASLREGWNMGIVGAFIAPERRGFGLARLALLDLLGNIRATVTGPSEYFHAAKEKERLFRTPIERFGFKPSWLHRERYDSERRASLRGELIAPDI